METLHVKYEFGEAINGKKDLLSSQANLIKMIKRLNAYKLLRFQELKKRQELRTKLNDFVAKTGFLEKAMPKAKTPKIEEEPVYFEETKNKTNLEDELKEIQEKLARLG